MFLTINKGWIKLANLLQYFESDFILRIASRCSFAIHSCYSFNAAIYVRQWFFWRNVEYMTGQYPQILTICPWKCENDS
jgi:hypothetical protein